MTLADGGGSDGGGNAGTVTALAIFPAFFLENVNGGPTM